MRSESAGYQTERQKWVTTPNAFLRFHHVKKRTDATEYAFAQDYAAHPVVSAATPKVVCVADLQGSAQSADPVAGRSTVGTIQAELVDVDLVITRQIADPAQLLQVAIAGAGPVTEIAVVDAMAYPAAGHVTIDAEDFSYTGRDDTVTPELLTGVTREARGTTAGAHTDGVAVVHNGERIRPGVRLTVFLGYAALAEADYGPGTGFTKLEVTGVKSGPSAGSWIVSAADIQRWGRKKVFRDAKDTTPVALASDNLITHALKVLLSTGTATNGPYDTLAAENGAGIPQALVDVAGLEALRDGGSVPNVLGVFNEIDPVAAKEFVEGQCFRPLGVVPFVTQAGKYSARRVAWTDLGITLDGSDILVDARTGRPRHAWLAFARVFNRLDTLYDFNVVGLRTGDFATRQVFTADQGTPNSVDTFGYQEAVVVPCRGIRTASGGQAALDAFAIAFLRTWAWAPPVLEIETTYRRHPLEALDPVEVTHPLIKHPVKGTLGLTAERFIVLDVQPSFLLAGKQTVRLLWVDPTTRADPSSTGAQTIVPSTPANLAVAENSSDVFPGGPLMPYVRLTWTAATDGNLGRYEVRWHIQGEAAWQMTTVASDLVTVKLPNLKASATYDFQIRSVATDNNVSAWSGIVSATAVQDAAPATPANVVLTETSELLVDGTFLGVIDVDWDDNAETDLAGYEVQWRPTGEAEYSITRIGLTSRHVLHGLRPNTQYDVRVGAFDGAGNASAFTGIANATTPANPGTPGTPTGLATTSMALSIVITWNANAEADIEHYQLDRSTAADFTADLVTLSKTKSTAYLDETGTTTTYYYRVKARRRSGAESSWTTGVSGAGLQVADSQIASLSVAKLLAGDLSVAVALVVGGILRSAAAGARVEIDKDGIRIYDGSGLTGELKADGTFQLGPGSGARVVITKNALEVFTAGGTSVAKIQNASPFVRIGADDGTALKLDGSGSLISLITAQLGTDSVSKVNSAADATGSSFAATNTTENTLLTFNLTSGTAVASVLALAALELRSDASDVTKEVIVRLKQDTTVIQTLRYRMDRLFNNDATPIFLPGALAGVISHAASSTKAYKITAQMSSAAGAGTIYWKNATVSALGVMR